jgi:hypothetical protein
MASPASEGAGLYGVMAEFPNPAAVLVAAERVRDAGYTKWDMYAPFPVHGIEEAMGMGPSKVSRFVGTGALIGVLGALLMQWWMSAVDYKIAVGGKPYFAWEQFFPITFELGILLGSTGAIVGMFLTNKLPMLYHPMMKKDRFLRVGDDKFFIAIEAADPKFDESEVRALLEQAGGIGVEEVEA